MRHLLVYILTLSFWTCKAQPGSSVATSAPYEQGSASVKELVYQRQSRAFNSSISASQALIKLTNTTEKPRTARCSKADWQELLKLAEHIEFKQLSTLQAPTSHRTYDGTAAARLTIKTEDTVWVSSTFDDGYPPQEIAELVYTLLAMEEVLLKE